MNLRKNSLSFCIVSDCDFDNSTFCGWENDKSARAKFTWVIWSGSTPSVTTGPQSDVSGSLSAVRETW